MSEIFKTERKLAPGYLALPLIACLGAGAWLLTHSNHEDKSPNESASALARIKQSGGIEILKATKECPPGGRRGREHWLASGREEVADGHLQYYVKIEKVYEGGQNPVYCGTDYGRGERVAFGGKAIISGNKFMPVMAADARTMLISE